MSGLQSAVSKAQESSSIAKTSAISGTVSYEQGRLASEKIVAYRVTARHGHRLLETGCTTFTDSNGYYLCKHLQAGSYLVVAENGSARKSSLANRLSSFVFYGGSQDLNNLVLISLGTKETQTADFQIPFSAGRMVSGSLPFRSPGATVGLYQTADSGLEYRSPLQAAYSKDGTFSFANVPPGRYELRERWFDGPQEIDASEGVEVAGTELSGLKVVPYHLRNVEVAIVEDGNSTRNIDSVLAEDIHTGSHAEADKRQGATFTLKEMKPGDYNLFVTSDRSVCVEGISVNGREVAQPLHIPSDDSPLDLGIRVGSNCGSIQGTLPSGRQGDVLVTTENFIPIKAIRSDSNGHFKANNLPVGRYLLFAWPSLQEIPFRDRSFLFGFKDRSASVEVDALAPLSALTVSVLN